MRRHTLYLLEYPWTCFLPLPKPCRYRRKNCCRIKLEIEEEISKIASPDCNYKQILSALMPRRHPLCLAAKGGKGTKRETFSIGFPLGTPFPIDQGFHPWTRAL